MNILKVSSSPHITSTETVPKIMYAVIIALIPAIISSVVFFGFRVLWITLVAILSCIIFEAISQKLMGRKIDIADGSAIITGILLAFNLPPAVPLWIPFIGGAFGIIFGKMVFGGLGHNILNPALVGRAFLMASWPVHMTAKWVSPRYGTLSGIDGITSATPLALYKSTLSSIADTSSTIEQIGIAQSNLSALSSNYMNFFTGNIGGCIGETSALLLLLGGIYLIIRKVIDPRVPLIYIGTVALLSWIFGGADGLLTGDPLFHILTGGLFLGAFFMATDMVTSPITGIGRMIFAFGCGVITVIIRIWGGYPEGVSYSILLMNLTVPLIDRFVKPKRFGGKSR